MRVYQRWILHVSCLAAVILMVAPSAHAFDGGEGIVAIAQASNATGIPYAWLYRVVGCETGHTFNPNVIGDGGTSFGAAQLHQGGGELPRFCSDRHKQRESEAVRKLAASTEAEAA